MPELGKVVVFGVGLIGGSFAAALKAAGAVREVVGFGRTIGSLQRAQQLGLIDSIGVSLGAEIRDADLVLLAIPVGQMAETMAKIVPYLGPRTVVTDAGSTKCDVVAAAHAAFGERVAQFVPAHPIAGAENGGPGAARADLYRGRKVVLTPLAENTPEAVETVRQAWRRCGAELFRLTPEAHDRVFAAVSHLPHLLSFALVHELATREGGELFFDFAASGFRDFTRIAASDAEMWRDIFLANRDALIDELDCYEAQLAGLRAALVAADGRRLQAILDVAGNARREWGHKLAGNEQGGSGDCGQ
jgi:prephenate dehydrogenase